MRTNPDADKFEIFMDEEKFEKNIEVVKAQQKEKISQIQKNYQEKAQKAENYSKKLKELWDLRNKTMKPEEQKQKQNLLAIENERKKKVNQYYEKLRYEESNPRQINKEKQKRIQELKNRNELLNERIKSANFIRYVDIEKRGEKIMQDLRNKEKITRRIFEEKKIIAEQIKEENDEKKKAFDCKYQILEIDKKMKLEEKREELDEKKKKLDDFILQKKMIQDEIRYLSDQYSLKNKIYHEQFDDMFSKRGLDEYTYMNIKGMISGDPKFRGIQEYYENK